MISKDSTLNTVYLFIYFCVGEKDNKKLSCFLGNIVSIQAKYQETEFLSPQGFYKRLKTH